MASATKIWYHSSYNFNHLLWIATCQQPSITQISSISATQGCSGVTTHAFLKMPLHSPVLTLCTPFETRVKDMTKQLERTSVIDEVIIEKLFF